MKWFYVSILLIGGLLFYACGKDSSETADSGITASCKRNILISDTEVEFEMCTDFTAFAEKDDGDTQKDCESAEDANGRKAGTFAETACASDTATASCKLENEHGGSSTTYVYRGGGANDVLKDSEKTDEMCEGGTYTEIVAEVKKKASVNITMGGAAFNCAELTNVNELLYDAIKSFWESMVATNSSASMTWTDDGGACETSTGVTASCKDANDNAGHLETTYYYGTEETKDKTECEGDSGTWTAVEASSLTGSCTTVEESGPYGGVTCTEYKDFSETALNSVKTDNCGGTKTWADSVCGVTGAIGKCTFGYAGSETLMQTVFYHNLQTPAVSDADYVTFLQSHCSGTFVDLTE